MQASFIEISEDAFDALFPLISNHLNPNASWCLTDQGGCLFETYGDELEFVRSRDPRTVWTLVDGDGGLHLTSGYHHVNRLGYLISKFPLPDGVDVQVSLDEPVQIGGDHEIL